MIRLPRRGYLLYGVLLLAAGCAGGSRRPDGPLDRLIEKTNAYPSFHLRGEINDGKQVVPVEMAFKAPGRALLKYGNIATTLQVDGKEIQILRGAQARLDNAAILAGLRERYKGLEVGAAPEPVFLMGDGLRARLIVGRLGARLGWLDELRTYQAEGSLYKHGQTEIVLREDGFIERTSLAGATFTLKDVQIGIPLPDSLFAEPPTAGLQDATARAQVVQLHELEQAVHRWILETSTTDETLETVVRADLIRKYEPEKLAAVLNESLQKSLAAFRTLHPDAKPEYLKDKLVIDRGRAMGSVEIMEDEIQKSFEKDLDGYFRGMPVPPPQKEMLDVARRWQAAVKKIVDEQIRTRFAAIFDAVEKN
jgi:hypothetical protein